ncbi:MAG TPA: hypothetical protein VGB18_08255, partial [Candidatus Thermoplasmatota archaeon]
ALTTPVADRHLFLHFADNDGTNDHIQVGDVVIKSGSIAVGTRVTGPTNGAGEIISGTPISFVASVFWLDVDGNNHYTPTTDPVYWNRPMTDFGGQAGTGLTRDDVRLTSVTTGGTTYAAGTIVATADKDVANLAGLAANDALGGAWFLLLHNADSSNHVELTVMSNARISGADTTWDAAVDGLYVSTATTVGDTVTRIFVSPNLGNTKVECNGAPDHADCTNAFSATQTYKTVVSGTTWTPTAGVYIDGDVSGTVTAGDTRIYHATLAPAAVAGGDADALLGTALLTNTKVRDDSGGNFYWDADNSAAVSNNDIRLQHDWGGGAPAAGTAVSCTPAYDFDCIAPLFTPTKLKVTGGDGTYTAGRSEYIYLSEDNIVNDEDFRFLDPDGVGALAAASNVVAGDADETRVAVGSGEKLYLSWCEGACGAAPTLIQVGDLEFGSINVVKDTNAGFVPVVGAVPTPTVNFVRQYVRGSVGVIDDVFYVDFGGAGLNVNDVRLVAFDSSNPAGSLIDSADTQELGASTTDVSGTTIAGAINYIDADNFAGYSAGDFVILDLPADLTGGGAFGTFDQGDVRLTKTIVGATSFTAGTIAKTGDTDLNTFTFGVGNPAWSLAFYDADRDTVFSIGDVLYAVPGALPASGTLPLNAVRLTGTAAASGGGGGGVVPPTPTTTLLNPTVTSTCAVASGSLTFSVTYRDTPDGRAPSTTNLVFNGINSVMTGSGSAYSTGVVYSATLSAPATAGSYPSSFSFTNSGGTTTLAGPTIVVLASEATAPTLANGMVTPASGEAGATYTWTVSYTDDNNDAPTAMNVVIDGISHAMTSSDSTYCDGATFTYAQTLAAGAHSYHFEFTAGGATARLPATGETSGPTIGGAGATTPATTDPDATTDPTPTSKKGGTPAPGLALIILAVLGLAVFMRRRE